MNEEGFYDAISKRYTTLLLFVATKPTKPSRARKIQYQYDSRLEFDKFKAKNCISLQMGLLIFAPKPVLH